MDYCRAEDEQKKNPTAEAHLRQIANGNEDAFMFMWRLWNFSHIYDDMVDRDKPVTVESAAQEFILLAQVLSFNPFYLTNAASLFPLMVSMFNRWCDAEEWEKSGELNKMISTHVIKCGDIDLYLTVAFITGGWEHMRNCRDARSYDLNFTELGIGG